MILDDIKTLLNITDTTQDNILNIYIRKAITLIKNYLNCPDSIDIQTTYTDAIIEYCVLAYNKNGNEGLKMFKIAGNEQEFGDEGLTKSIKDLLPFPYVKMLGV